VVHVRPRLSAPLGQKDNILILNSAGVTCSLDGECAKGKPVSSAGSGSESDGNHKPKTKPSEVMQLAKQLRASKHMVTQDGGASDDSS